MTDPAYAWMVIETDAELSRPIRVKTMAVGSEEECQDACDSYTLTGNETDSYVCTYATRHDTQ